MFRFNFVSFVTLSIVCGFCSAKSLPNYIQRCSENDPQLTECMTKQANDLIPRIPHGDKKLRIPDLSPVVVDSIETSIGRLNIGMKNINIYGLDKTHVESIELDKKAQTLTLKIFIPEVFLKSIYKMQGTILVLPVEGSGPMEIRMDGANFVAILSFENLRRDSTEKIKFLDSNLDYKFRDISLKFENLFNGNKQLADPVHKLLNEEKSTINEDFKPIFVETINSVVKSIVKRVFERYQFSDMFLP